MSKIPPQGGFFVFSGTMVCMSWAWRRRLIYLSILFILFGVPTGIYLTRALYVAPTCFDGRQNQGEVGVDCGGPCQLLCYAESIPPIVHWARIFKVGEGIYIAAAYIENPNEAAQAVNKPYEMKVYDREGIPIFTRQGVVSLDPREFTAIVETGILLNQSEASRVQFDWLGEAEGWVRATAEPLALTVSNVAIQTSTTTQRVTATLSNPTLQTFRNFDVSAIVYDASGNAVGVSKTFVDRLDPSAAKDVVFSWPRPFPAVAVEAQVLPSI